MNGRFWSATLVAILLVGIGMSILEAISGDGFWSPLVYIGATAYRAYQNTIPPIGFAAGPVVAGLIIHALVSILGTAILGAIVYNMRSRGGAALAGAIYGLAFFAVMWYIVLPAVNPVMLNLNMGYMVITHLLWGAIAAPILTVPAMATVGRRTTPGSPRPATSSM